MNLQAPKQRNALRVMDSPVWQPVGFGRHLGYRKGVTTSSWYARIRTADLRYSQHYLGMADDSREADGRQILSFAQAVVRATEWFEATGNQARAPEKPSKRPSYPDLPPGPPYSVAHAMAEYLKWYRENRRGFDRVYYATMAQILPELGSIPLDGLKTAGIRDWANRLTESEARVRTRQGLPQQYRPKTGDPEEQRRRRNSTNRILAFLKAALTRAYENSWVDSDLAWRRVRPFRRVEARNARHLTKKEVTRLLAALPHALRQLSIGALITGCRVAEIKLLKVGAFLPKLQRIVINKGKGGFRRHISLTNEGAAFFRKMAKGRGSDDFMFTQASGLPWRRDGHVRQFQKASSMAGINPPVTFRHLRHTHASRAAMAGIPLPVIAKQLGHRDTRMVEFYYAHLASSYVDDIIRNKMPSLL